MLSLTPTIEWYQNNEFLILKFQIIDATNENINIEEDKIFFYALSQNKEYRINFELYENIDNTLSKYIIETKNITLLLKKKNNEKWIFLTKDRTLYKNNIKIDWNNWKEDSDDDEGDECNNGMNFDFQKMMQNMGGENDFPNFGEDHEEDHEEDHGEDHEEDHGEDHEEDYEEDYEEDHGEDHEEDNEEDN